MVLWPYNPGVGVSVLSFVVVLVRPLGYNAGLG